MLSGIEAALAVAKSDNYTAVQQLLKDHVSEWVTYPCVDGSFKKVYSLPGGSLALACFREKDNKTALINGKILLTKEKELLNFLQSLGLQTVNIHGEPFEINNQYAILMSWISDAHFIDVKDQEASTRKLISVLLGIAIPTGEGWVLRKNAIEAEISEKLSMKEFLLERVKERAASLHKDFTKIQATLAENGYLVADLQLLVNDHGVFIIDPIDVVKMMPMAYSSNMMEYQSVLENTIQTNSDFIKLLHDGRRMLERCITFCHAVMSVASKDELEQKILTTLQPQELVSPRTQSSLQKMLLIKNLGSLPTGTPSAISPKKSSGTSPITSPRYGVQVQTCRMLKPKNTINIQSTSSTLMSTSDPVPSELPVLPEVRQEPSDSKNENVLESPTKVLAFQFSATKLSEASSVVARRLFDDKDHQKPLTDEPTQKTSNLYQPQ